MKNFFNNNNFFDIAHMNKFLVFFLVIIFLSCENKESGINYIGNLVSNDSINIPFKFKYQKSGITIYNGEESVFLRLNDNFKDSLRLESSFFEDYINFKKKGDSINGNLYNQSLSRKIPFYAVPGVDRFQNEFFSESIDISGEWRIIFNFSKSNSYEGKLIVNQSNSDVISTVRTETGDYGYMEGKINYNELSISNFNGSRAYLIKGKLNNDTIRGHFYRGNYGYSDFIAFKDDNFRLSDPYGLTSLKEGYKSFDFKFEDINGKIISNNDKKFEDKLILVQIMGSWCPNCIDESKYLSQLSGKYKDISIVSIAFEYAKEKNQAINNLKKIKKNLNIEYDLLLGGYGSTDKKLILEKLNSLDKLISYPTLVVMDKNKIVRKIHTGFNGPATANEYEKFKYNFEEFLKLLIAE